jgi:proline iminopeptidase
MLPVSDGHRLYYEVSGNPSGQPAIFLHGGPGAGTSPKARGFFDPAHYKIVLFDQRGSGKSEPFASLESNTTPHLVADIEALRVFLSIERWLVFGGSWGSTLALAYSQAHPSRVTHLVLRGIFMLRKAELDFFYQGPGSGWLFPREWEAYLAPIPEAEQGDMVAAYHKRLTGDDPEVRAAACKAWSTWEGATSKLLQDADVVGQFSSDKFAESLARIECHYFVNKGFFKTEDELLRGVERIRHIPSIIVQGRYDLVRRLRPGGGMRFLLLFFVGRGVMSTPRPMAPSALS